MTTFKTVPTLSLKDMVSDNKKVNFAYYRDGQLWYQTEDGFIFPVDINDIGNATFLAQDKALLFMRYIRKRINSISEERND